MKPEKRTDKSIEPMEASWGTVDVVKRIKAVDIYDKYHQWLKDGRIIINQPTFIASDP